MGKPHFLPNYPNHRAYHNTLLPTLKRIRTPARYTGKGVTIAFVDSGFSNHPDLHGRIISHIDASTNRVIEQTHIPETSPMSWHGQMTSVIGAGDGRTSDGHFRGIASASHLILVKVSTPDFRIKEADILRGLRWVYDTRRRTQVRIVNVSVGGDNVSQDPDHPLHLIVRKLVQAGIVVVIAAGNGGHPSLVPPASAPEALVIGGYDDHNSLDEERWTIYHHNYGTVYNGARKPDLLAPAAWIASPLLPGSSVENEAQVLARLLHTRQSAEVLDLLKTHHEVVGLKAEQIEKITPEILSHLQDRIHHHKIIDAAHQHVDGTSVAAPIVTGVIAQMLELAPNLQPTEIRRILTTTATPLARWPAQRQGAGVLNAQAALEQARNEAHRGLSHKGASSI